MNPIAYIRSPFKEKFGIPRQSNLVEGLMSEVVLLPPYRSAEALRGIEGFDYLWLIWQFSKHSEAQWTPTVRPPRLGGNSRIGVFASRSPFRPNGLGLSSVRLREVCWHGNEAPLLRVEGADLLDRTPIFDIKPYLPYTDAHPEARSGWAPSAPEALEVECPEALLGLLPEGERQPLLNLLAHDPRPAFHHDASRSYAMLFGDYDVRFVVDEAARRLSVKKIVPLSNS